MPHLNPSKHNLRSNNPSTQPELFPAVLSRAAGSGANRVCQTSRLNAELLQLVVPVIFPYSHDAISPPNHRSSCSLHTSGNDVRRSLRVSDRGMSPVTIR